MPTYAYSISRDTAQGCMTPARLQSEILISGISKELIDVSTPDFVELRIEYTETLSEAEKTTLDAVVKAHTGYARPLEDGSGSVTFRQSVYARITTDNQVTANQFVPILTKAISTEKGALIIFASVCASVSSQNIDVDFRVVVDGSPGLGASISPPGGTKSGPAAINLQVPVEIGVHTVTLQAKVSNKGTARIRPVTVPTEHAQLIILEVA